MLLATSRAPDRRPGVRGLTALDAPTHDRTAPKIPSRRAGIALVAVAAVLWSTGGMGVKLVDQPAMVIAGWRSLFALIAMSLVLLARARAGGRVAPTLRRPLVWAGAVAYATMVTCFVLAAKLSTAANAIFIQYTGPLWIAVVSWPLLRERVRGRDWAVLALTAIGMVLFFLGQLEARGLAGNLVAVVSSFGFAGVPLAMRLEEKRSAEQGIPPAESPMMSMTLGNLLTALVCLPWMATHPLHGGVEWGALLGLGTLQIALPYVLYGTAVRALSALESSLIATIEPVIAPFWVLIATGERPENVAIAGGALIVASVVLRAILNQRS